MNTQSIDQEFPRGLLSPELFLGVTASVTARTVGVNLSEAGRPSGSHFSGGRYGRGEVGEFVLIEGQQSLLLGRIAEIRLREPERRGITHSFVGDSELDALGSIQLLGCVAMDDLRVTAGVDAYPRLGDRIYAAPHRFIALLPRLMEPDEDNAGSVTLNLGAIDVAHESAVSIKPERLFGRHCAILGATGGGKSWTTARIIEESIKHKAKLILIDATSEYRDFAGDTVMHCHLGDPVHKATASLAASLPPTSFLESDFVALFEPAGKVQGPKLRAAMRSLRLAKLQPQLAVNGCLRKHEQLKQPIADAELNPDISALLDDPRQPFDVSKLVSQIEQECVWPNGGTQRAPDLTRWGAADEGGYANCLSLFTRISGVLTSPAFRCVFQDGNASALTSQFDAFIAGEKRLLRICLSGIAYEYHAREIIANVIGRHLLIKARDGAFQQRPTVVMVDEAHNFLGRHIGAEDYAAKLDAFELIAKEGRKYGLNICLASQRPRDITEGVLSQMGTMIVHRLTNDQDREVVERACGEIDRAASAFLPNLRPGEAAIIGTDFPIPLTIQIHEPSTKPKSDGPRFQEQWAIVPHSAEASE
ncbi:MAG: cell division protein FtsK [Lentisphaerae bacterium RIFOXYC12_FULL_60_16]|nr:MAG: cell division protein FtsK [Lentisphaerae bacterium RIFOXYC12_FULL_60_16]